MHVVLNERLLLVVVEGAFLISNFLFGHRGFGRHRGRG